MHAASQRRRATWQALLALACVAVATALPSAPHASEAPVVAASAAPERAVVEREVPYLGVAGPTLDVHHPVAAVRPARRAPAVLVVHGGAWSGGDKQAIGHVARALASAGFVAVNVNYTLAAVGRPGFPRQVDELRAAIRWMRRNASRLGIDPTRIGALGSSAGAHLSTLLATSTTGPLTAGGRLAAVVAWSPPTELGVPRLRARLRFKIAGFLGCAPCRRRSAAASPLSHVTPDDPPTMIVNSRRELIPVSQARRLANRFRQAGVPVRLRLLPGTLHAPLFSPSVLGPSISFLRKRLR
jgi:acetyl esterase/lipase